eukprot:1079968_1
MPHEAPSNRLIQNDGCYSTSAHANMIGFSNDSAPRMNVNNGLNHDAQQPLNTMPHEAPSNRLIQNDGCYSTSAHANMIGFSNDSAPRMNVNNGLNHDAQQPLNTMPHEAPSNRLIQNDGYYSTSAHANMIGFLGKSNDRPLRINVNNGLNPKGHVQNHSAQQPDWNFGDVYPNENGHNVDAMRQTMMMQHQDNKKKRSRGHGINKYKRKLQTMLSQVNHRTLSNVEAPSNRVIQNDGCERTSAHATMIGLRNDSQP